MEYFFYLSIFNMDITLLEKISSTNVSFIFLPRLVYILSMAYLKNIKIILNIKKQTDYEALYRASHP